MTKRTQDAPPAQYPPARAQVASMANASAEDVQSLLDKIVGLQELLKVEKAARTEAEKKALAAAEAQGMLIQSDIQEVATGKTVTVKRAFDDDGNQNLKVVGYKDDGRDILRPVFRDVKLPTYFYKIILPPVGGFDLKINGMPLYHNTVYEFDIDTLRTVKEMVYRLKDHERSIHGSDENFYRNPRQDTLSARAARG